MRSDVGALERAPLVNCEGDEVIDIDTSIVVVDMLMFIDAELESGCIVIFMTLVVEEPAPEDVVYTAALSLVDETMLAGMTSISATDEVVEKEVKGEIEG